MTSTTKMTRCLAILVLTLWTMLAGTAQAQVVVYYHTDALGSPVATTDASGNVLERTEYEPYGQVVNPPVNDGPGYTGHVSDAETGLVYMQQRYYDPQIGRFLSMDPMATDATTGRNFNRYWYASNNPYRFIDPDGRADRPWYDMGGNIGDWFTETGRLSMMRAYNGPNEATDDAIAEQYKKAGIFILSVQTAALPEMGAAMQVSTRATAPTMAQITRFSVFNKLERYLLNPSHPIGGSKAQFFQRALGFSRENMGELAKQIRFDPSKAVQTASTEYGIKYNQTISITGANGRNIDVVFAWMKSNRDNVVRLITATPVK